MNEKIILECASWFVRDDGLIQIRNKNGLVVILNELSSSLWNEIEYEIERKELKEKMGEKGIVGEVVDKIIADLEKKDLVRTYSNDNESSMIFDW